MNKNNIENNLTGLIGKTILLPTLEYLPLSLTESNKEVSSITFEKIKVLSINTNNSVLGLTWNKNKIIIEKEFLENIITSKDEITDRVKKILTGSSIKACRIEKIPEIVNIDVKRTDINYDIDIKELYKVRTFSSPLNYNLKYEVESVSNTLEEFTDIKPLLFKYDTVKKALSLYKPFSVNELKSSNHIFFGKNELNKGIVYICNDMYSVFDKNNKKNIFKRIFKI